MADNYFRVNANIIQCALSQKPGTTDHGASITKRPIRPRYENLLQPRLVFFPGNKQIKHSKLNAATRIRDYRGTVFLSVHVVGRTRHTNNFAWHISKSKANIDEDPGSLRSSPLETT
jgi:hypothetical protein